MEHKNIETYSKLFKIDEIQDSKLLQIVFYVITFSFFTTFFSWASLRIISISYFLKGYHVCPPYFQSCGDYYFLEAQPYGYTQGLFYVLLFLLLGYGVISALRKDWVSAHMTMLVALIWKFIFLYLFTYGFGGNYDYYDMVLAFVWLFLRQKEYFLKVAFVMFYFIASTVKIHEGWILGNFFTATITGAPFFTNGILPLVTNLVIIMQMVGCWFLLSNNKTYQRLSFFYFFLFHAYSGIIVHYRYISISITALVVLFGYNFKLFQIDEVREKKLFKVLKISKETFAGYFLMLLILMSQGVGFFIQGDQKKTLEGNFYGLYMFEANHQCISTPTITYKDGTSKVIVSESHFAKARCDPYRYWYPLKTLCVRDTKIKSIAWTFDHSINGHAYQRIVSEENACTLSYNSLKHNQWIKIGGEAKDVPTPVYKNGYASDLYPESYVIPTSPTPVEKSTTIEAVYTSVWVVTLLVCVFMVINA